ncbi:MAG: hypothetical protein TREMPRED_002082 [Tremellales sp. Tagirdzhanova-0007]|nr:MAG: hypothetical protein TREMPRED_002082 [Tremellales sp. Tagirdzhanova-0007]
MVEVDSARPPGTSSRQPRPSLDAPPRKSRFTENLPGAPKEEGDPTARTATTDEERSTVSPPLSVKLPPEVQTTKSSPVKTPERSRLSPSSSPKKTPVDKGSSKRPPVLTPASADDSSDGGQRTASSVESGRGERGRKRDKISQGTEGEEEPPVGTPRRRLPSTLIFTALLSALAIGKPHLQLRVSKMIAHRGDDREIRREHSLTEDDWDALDDGTKLGLREKHRTRNLFDWAMSLSAVFVLAVGGILTSWVQATHAQSSIGEIALETLMGLASLGWVVVRMIYRRIPEAVSMRLKKGRDVAGRGADQVARKTRQVRSRV